MDATSTANFVWPRLAPYKVLKGIGMALLAAPAAAASDRSKGHEPSRLQADAMVHGDASLAPPSRKLTQATLTAPSVVPPPPHDLTSALPKVTLAMPNYARVANTKKIVDVAVNQAVIDEILIWDDPKDSEHTFVYDHPKVSIIRTSSLKTMQKWGMLARFKWALLARNEHVLIQDDDQLLEEPAIKRMMQAKARDPDRLVCYVGRETFDYSLGESITYVFKEPTAPAYIPICLTKSVLTDRRFLLETIRRAPLVEDLARRGKPYWNGEDIWHSLVALDMTGKLHTLLPIDRQTYMSLPAPHGISDPKVHHDGFNHDNYRRFFTQYAALRLGLQAKQLERQFYAEHDAEKPHE